MPDPETLIQLAERDGYNARLEVRQAFAHTIETGRGRVWLELTEAQYRKLNEMETTENSSDAIRGHIDTEALFAWVERRDDPNLCGKPVVVRWWRTSES